VKSEKHCYITETIASYCNKKNVYAQPGLKAKIISVHGDVYLLEHPKGYRFPCHISKLKLVQQ